MEPIAVYVHIPFCPSKCGYCDFNSFAMDGPIVERTAQAIVEEIERSPFAGRPAKTIFFGGGTPTFLPAQWLERILRAVRSAHSPTTECEISSEANPGTVDAEKFAAMREAGFDRISIGAQSFVPADLIVLERVHQASDIGKAVAAARSAGFKNLNLDLMFALPGQSMAAWKRNLDRAMELEPDHLSLYCLTIEENTQFYKYQKQGRLDLPDEDAQVDMFEATVDVVESHGFRTYEISNFAKPGHECRHNLCYWRGEPYVGYGPGAVGRLEQWPNSPHQAVRYTNLKHPDRYCHAIESGEPTAFDVEPLSPETLKMERIMLGIRLTEGVKLDPNYCDKRGVEKCVDLGWIHVVEDRAILTRLGRRFCTEVALEITPDLASTGKRSQ